LKGGEIPHRASVTGKARVSVTGKASLYEGKARVSVTGKESLYVMKSGSLCNRQGSSVSPPLFNFAA